MGGALSIGWRVTKIDACLSSVAVYQMSMRILHKSNVEALEKSFRSFLWADNSTKRKYHLGLVRLQCFRVFWGVYYLVFWVKTLLTPKTLQSLPIPFSTKIPHHFMLFGTQVLQRGVLAIKSHLFFTGHTITTRENNFNNTFDSRSSIKSFHST